MANAILDSHLLLRGNAILTSHGFPDSGPYSNGVLSSYTPGIDVEPADFSLDTLTDVALGSDSESTPFTLADVDGNAYVSVSGAGQYRFGAFGYWGSYRSTPGLVGVGSDIQVKHTNSGANSTTTETTLKIGSKSATLSSTTLAATGTFTAVLDSSTGVLTITDPSNNLGTKPTVTPLFARAMLTDSVGTLWSDLGGSGQGYSAKENDYLLTEQLAEVVAGEGIGGAPALMSQHIAGSINNKAKFTKFFASQQQAVFTSYWIKFVDVAPMAGERAGWVQLKWRRIGQSMPTLATHGSDANDQYSPRPGMFIAMWIDEDTGEWPADILDEKPWYDALPTGGGGNIWGGDTTYLADGLALPASEFAYGKDVYFETWDKMNDIGSSNGEARWRINGTTMYDRSGFELRLSGDENFGHIMPFTGPDMSAGHLNAYQSRIYIDNTKQRVCLGDDPDFALCSGLINLPPTEWAAGLVKTADGLFIPGTYIYLFVLDENENVVSNSGVGFEYSVT